MPVDTTRYDLRLDSDGDLFISSNGDFVIAPSDEQHIQDNIHASPNSWKQFPDIGVNIDSYVNGSFDKQTLEKKIRLNLLADQYDSSPVLKYSADGRLIVNTNVQL